MSDGLTALERIRDAATHAMHLRCKHHPVPVEMRVLPVGIEIEVRSFGRSIKRLIGWQTIEQARSNVLSSEIDDMVARRNDKPTV